MPNALEMLGQKLTVSTKQLAFLTDSQIEDVLVFLDAEEAQTPAPCPQWLRVWRDVERCQASARARKIELLMLPQAIDHHREVYAWVTHEGLDVSKLLTWLDGGAVYDPRELGPGSNATWLSIQGLNSLSFEAKRKLTRASKFDDLARATSYVPCPKKLKAADFSPPGTTMIRKFRGHLLIYRPISRMVRP